MFKIKTISKTVTEHVISDLYTTSRINQLIRDDAEKQSIKVTGIVHNANHTAKVTGRPANNKKKMELNKQLQEEQKGASK